MRALWRRFKNGYLNLSLQTKFTIALISIVVVPACLTAFLFYGRLYSMVVSNTIRQEQDASAKTAPLIERTMDTILATTRNITGQNVPLNEVIGRHKGSLDGVVIQLVDSG